MTEVASGEEREVTREKRRGTDRGSDRFGQRRKGEKEDMTAENARKHVERQTQTGG